MKGAKWLVVWGALGGITGSVAQAQSEKIVFTGAGRSWLHHDRVAGALLDSSEVDGGWMPGDTVTPRRVMAGVALFDLGVIARPDRATEIVAVTRVTSTLDGFWGQGVGFQVRELYARGVIGGRIRYRVGDLDLRLTPYTLWNGNGDLGNRLPDLWRVWSDWVDYDRFQRDGFWRQQGLDVDAVLSSRFLDELAVRGALTKQRTTDYFFQPDRLLGLAELKGQRGLWNGGYRMVSLFDVAPTAQFSTAAASSTVHSLDVQRKPSGAGRWTLGAEAGFSQTRFVDMAGAPDPGRDGFVEAWGRWTARDTTGAWRGVSWTIEARRVGTGFRSPGAQSRRTDWAANSSEWGFYTNQERVRPLTTVDLLQDPGVYRPTLSMGLQAYNPVFRNAMPYGAATPNRQGIAVAMRRDRPTEIFSFSELRLDWATELAGQGIANLRNMAVFDGYTRLRLDRLYGGKRPFAWDLHLHAERTERAGLTGLGEGMEGLGAIDWKQAWFAGGFNWQFQRDLGLQFSLLTLRAQGTEYLAQRDVFDRIIDYRRHTADLQERVLAAGLNYRFTDSIRLDLQYRALFRNDALLAAYDYQWSQWSLLYTLFF
jgi:hypothetical protein